MQTSLFKKASVLVIASFAISAIAFADTDSASQLLTVDNTADHGHPSPRPSAPARAPEARQQPAQSRPVERAPVERAPVERAPVERGPVVIRGPVLRRGGQGPILRRPSDYRELGFLAAGNYRTPDGAVYYVNGVDAFCLYSSWDAFVAAGGSNGDWATIPYAPTNEQYDGYCN